MLKTSMHGTWFFSFFLFVCLFVWVFIFCGGVGGDALHYNDGSNLAEIKLVLGASCNSNVAEARFEIIPE